MAKTKRVSFTLPSPLVDDLSYISDRIGVTRSALLAELTADGLSSLRELVELIPANPTSGDLLRARGRSHELISSRIGALQASADSAFAAVDDAVNTDQEVGNGPDL